MRIGKENDISKYWLNIDRPNTAINAEITAIISCMTGNLFLDIDFITNPSFIYNQILYYYIKEPVIPVVSN